MPIARTRYLGIVEEYTYGVLSASPLWNYLDFASASIDPPGDEKIIWGGASNRAPYVYQPGAYSVSGDVELPVDSELFGWFLKWLFGSVASATQQTDKARLHTFTPADTLKSFNAKVGKDTMEYQVYGLGVGDLSINIEKELAVAKVALVGQKDAKNAIGSPTLNTPGYFFPFHRAALKYGDRATPGAAIPFERMTFSYKNNLDTKDTIRLGSRFPNFLNVGERDVTLEGDLAFTNTDALERFWSATGATGPASTTTNYTPFSMFLELTGPAIAGSSPMLYNSLYITLPQALITQVKKPVQKRDRIKVGVTYKALYKDATDKDVKAELYTPFARTYPDAIA